jgi:hypothetical protein
MMTKNIISLSESNGSENSENESGGENQAKPENENNGEERENERRKASVIMAAYQQWPKWRHVAQRRESVIENNGEEKKNIVAMAEGGVLALAEAKAAKKAAYHRWRKLSRHLAKSENG